MTNYMVKLTVNPKKEKKIYTFDKKAIVIGSKASTDVDINLPNEGIKDIHLKIFELGDTYIAHNIANDPFTTINEMPFGKRALSNGDIVQIGNTDLCFEYVDNQKTLEEIFERKMQTKSAKKIDSTQSLFTEDSLAKSSDTPQKDLKNKSSYEEPEEIDIDLLVKEIEALENRYDRKVLASDEELYPNSPQKNNGSDFNFNEYSEKKNALSEESLKHQFQKYGDETDNLNSNDIKPSKSRFSYRWKLWLSTFVVVICAVLIISGGVYSRIEEKSELAELQAARAVSDIALALTYAQINRIQPPQQNWADPHFLKNNIHAVLSYAHQPLATVGPNGRLNNGEYMLRIYTNRDVSRFLVIAQPEPSLMHWLSPQNAIVVDSRSMVLHLISDLRPLNRLLVNPNSLNGDNGREVADLVKTEKIIPLKKLADPENKNGFEAPKQLEFIKSGAENYVYNALRYSQVGEKFLDQAIDLVTRPGRDLEIKKLQEEFNIISKLPNTVLYTSKGMKAALKGQKALAELLPDQKFLVAYLHFDSNGQMKGSHLILDQEPIGSRNVAQMAFKNQSQVGSYQPLVIAAKAPEYVVQKKEDSLQESKGFEIEVDKHSPLYTKIHVLNNERKEKLEPFSDQLINLILLSNSNPPQDHVENLNELFKNYLKVTFEVNQETLKRIEDLYQEYSFMPLSEFKEYVKQAGFGGLAKIHLQQVAKTSSPVFSEDQFAHLLEDVSEAASFDQLNKVTSSASQVLRLENIPSSSLLIQYQNRLRTHVLGKLKEMLLTPSSKQIDAKNSQANRILLSKILLHSWVIDPEEQAFYLKEYDHIFTR